jgi:hypothetical protein
MGVRRGTGICECSGAQSEPKPRSSSAKASSVDEIDAQGTEADGHGASRATFPLVPAIVDEVARSGGEVPVVAAGGIADVDRVSNGRFLFGVGGGWNAEEIQNHGTDFKTRFKKMREQIED